MSAAAKLGLFMMIIMGILAFFILRIEDLRIWGPSTRTIDVVFDSVAGLNDGADVRVAGVRVGKVSKIELRPDGQALVTLEVKDDVPLRQGATARVANLGLLGEKYVELIPGRPEAPLLPEDDIVLSGTMTASVDDVTTQISLIAEDVKAITASMRVALGGDRGEQRLDEIVDNIRDISRSMRDLIATNEINISRTAENLRIITDDLRVELPRIAATIERTAGDFGGTLGENREDIREIVRNLRQLSVDLGGTSENLGALTGQMRSGEGTIGKLLYSDEAHERLTSALEAVEGGVVELRDTMGRLTRMELELGIKGDYYAGMSGQEGRPSLEGNSRSAITLDLWPNPERNRFYHIALANDPRGDIETKIIDQTITHPDGTTETTRIREEKVERDFLLSAQAAWRLEPLTLRIGLFDSTGGIGADYHFNRRLRVTGEAFDFGQRRGDHPHLRLFGEYVISPERENFPLIFVSTGVDNPLNDTAVTFGGGIRWTDDDLKYLLGSIPLR
jgi:phospholipid/cholesterol/gamma-HCH transport system substrate-binding protein